MPVRFTHALDAEHLEQELTSVSLVSAEVPSVNSAEFIKFSECFTDFQLEKQLSLELSWKRATDELETSWKRAGNELERSTTTSWLGSEHPTQCDRAHASWLAV